MFEIKVTVCLPIYNRPARTIRAIKSILDQEFTGYEAYLVGDGCPNFDKLMQSNFFVDNKPKEGNFIYPMNIYPNRGGFGFSVRNYIIDKAIGEYLLFLDNDDVIKPNHISTYYNAIKDTDYDFMYFDSYIEPYNTIRASKLEEGQIGHSELIIKTEFLKQMPKQSSNYGHDWSLVKEMMKKGKHSKSNKLQPTYIVKSVPDKREQNIN